MNDNMIESINWHKDQLSRLMESEDFRKVESEIDFILEKETKHKERVTVRGKTGTYTRMQEKGKKEEKKDGKKESPKSKDKPDFEGDAALQRSLKKLKEGAKLSDFESHLVTEYRKRT